MSIENLNILIAEDHNFQRSAVARMLNSLGAKKVHEAADGHGALKVLNDPALPVDIVISDLDMPGMDGMEFIRRLGESGAPVAVILVSALERQLLASVQTAIEAYGLDLLGLMEKPITPEKLTPLIERYRLAKMTLAQPKPGAARPSFTLQEIEAGLKNDEFEPFLHPKIELATWQVKGVEALARWRHPRHGVVEPHAFIGPLEAHDRIDELTWIMLGKSAALCSAWHSAGLNATVSVNLSPKSLGHGHLADRVTQVVRDQGLEPRHMILEVTESAAATDVGMALENLARLRMKGFGLSIDDYGTGYSSMQQLSRIAFTELKIDQSFVANAARQESARVILESSLDMAQKLNITSVAEGVETKADWGLLRRLGCSLAQGYLIARPMVAGSFLEWARAWQTPALRNNTLPPVSS